MIRRVVGFAAACVVMNATWAAAQPVRAVPRPPAQAPGPPRPEDGSAAPDGYAPIAQWLGQTRAPRPAKSAAFDVDTIAGGLDRAFCLGFPSVDWPQRQQLDSNMGKVMRINADGSIPKDNPFAGRAGAHPEIYALGFRDIQGVAIHPRTGALWTSEHGPRGGDEINVVERGKNYGFPVIGYGRGYSGKPINGGKTAQDGMEQPVYFWTPDIAPAGIGFYTGKLVPLWEGKLFVATLAGKALVRLVLDGARVIGEERLLTDLNSRIRGVSEGPDGALYVMTDGQMGKIVKLTPRK